MKTTKKLIESFSKTETMSSYDFWNMLNKIRESVGSSHVRHDQYLERVKDECDLFNCNSFSVKNTRGNKELEAYMLNQDQMILVGMRESKVIRKRVLKWLRELSSMVNDLKQKKIERSNASLNYKTQSDMIKKMRDSEGKETRFYHFCTEADLLNSFVLGMSAAKYRKLNELEKTDNLRDTLTVTQLECIASLETHNTSFISAGIDYNTRKELLTKIYNRDFNDLLIQEHLRIEG